MDHLPARQFHLFLSPFVAGEERAAEQREHGVVVHQDKRSLQEFLISLQRRVFESISVQIYVVLSSTSPKYCTQGKETKQLTPSSQENNGKRSDLPKHTYVILDKPQAYQQSCSLNSASIPTNHRHQEPFAVEYLYFLKAVSRPPCPGSPNSSHFPAALGGEWLLEAGGEAAFGHCCPTPCAWCELCAPL